MDPNNKLVDLLEALAEGDMSRFRQITDRLQTWLDSGGFVEVTFEERQHWKDRIKEKCEEAIDEVLYVENAGFMEAIQIKAKAMALESLGITELRAEVEKIDAERNRLEFERVTAFKRLVAVVRGVDIEDIHGNCWNATHEVTSAIERRKKAIEKQLLASHEVGRRILKLRRERDALLDKAMLTTTLDEIRTLWGSVTDVLKPNGKEP